MRRISWLWLALACVLLGCGKHTLPPPSLDAYAPAADTRSADQIAVAACTSPSGEWRCSVPRPKTFAASGSQPVIPASWTVSNWYFDPANSSGTASDANNCTTSGTPCSTWGEIWVHRLGAGNPQLQQATTFNQLSAQTINVDPIFGSFELQNGNQAILKGQLIQVCTIAGGVATVTTQAPGAPGTRWQVSNMCGGAAGSMLLQDTTKSPNTWAVIDSISVSTATTSQPMVAGFAVTWPLTSFSTGAFSTNDAFTVWKRPLSNVKAWSPTTSSDLTTAAVMSTVEVSDSSGSVSSTFTTRGSGTTSMQSVLFDANLEGSASTTNSYGSEVLGTTTLNLGTLNSFAGIAQALVVNAGVLFFNLAPVIHMGTSTVQQGGFLDILGAFVDGSVLQVSGETEILGGSNAFWGSQSIRLFPGGTFYNGSGTTWANALKTTGTLNIGGGTTGFTSPNCGTFTNNGVTQVDTTPAAGHWPAGSTFSWSLNTVGGTACLSGGPYFSAAVTADNLFTKAVTASCNDVYNYCAQPASVSLTTANLDLYNGLRDINTGAQYANTQ